MYLGLFGPSSGGLRHPPALAPTDATWLERGLGVAAIVLALNVSIGTPASCTFCALPERGGAAKASHVPVSERALKPDCRHNPRRADLMDHHQTRGPLAPAPCGGPP